MEIPSVAPRAARVADTKHVRINSSIAGYNSQVDLQDGGGSNVRRKSLASGVERLVVVRYFLDRPGYSMKDSACRFWVQPPAVATPADVLAFLQGEGIALDGLLVEVYLDSYEAFMLLDAAAAAHVQWDFENTNHRKPGRLDIRLTDLHHAAEEEKQVAGPVTGKEAPNSQVYHHRELANTIPICDCSPLAGTQLYKIRGGRLKNMCV